MNKFLTKTRFKVGLECPSKLLYLDKPEYPNKKDSNTFLEQLANGGFQVEALARLKYSGGTMVDNNSRIEATKLTERLLSNDNVVIYESSFLVDNLNARADLVVKSGNTLNLIEVKAKAATKNQQFVTRRNLITKDFRMHLWDLAFQTFVAKKQYPNLTIKSFLMFVNKEAVASVDGVNQMFLISNDAKNKRNVSLNEGLSYSQLGNDLLIEFDVTEVINDILSNKFTYTNNKNFTENLELIQAAYFKGKCEIQIGRKCKDCEFKLSIEQQQQSGLLSGFDACWLQLDSVNESTINSPKVYDIYDSKFATKVMAEDNIVFAKDLEERHLSNSSEDCIGFTIRERQLLQIEDIKHNYNRVIVDYNALSSYQRKIQYPLNMIDFETSTTALPFTAGMRPYENVAFQFSHHIINEDGSVTHANQWICAEPGEFPNFEFVRALKKSLEVNEGSVFRYHNHENSVLNSIRVQLENSKEQDKNELIGFIEKLTKRKLPDNSMHIGERCMIDLCELLRHTVYDTNYAHSLSLKVVLPAILKSNDFIRSKYSKTISEINLSSLNFSDNHRWLEGSDSEVYDPYKNLATPFEGFSDEDLNNLLFDLETSIDDGGAAMMAYAKMQFTQMLDAERKALQDALLKYCELDTLAMVMIWEYITNVTKNN